MKFQHGTNAVRKFLSQFSCCQLQLWLMSHLERWYKKLMRIKSGKLLGLLN